MVRGHDDMLCLALSDTPAEEVKTAYMFVIKAHEIQRLATVTDISKIIDSLLHDESLRHADIAPERRENHVRIVQMQHVVIVISYI